MLGDGLRQPLGQHWVDLDRGHLGAPVEQGQRQRAQTGADLEHVVVAVDPGRRDDPADSVGVVDEILPERFTWAKVNLFRQMAYLGPTE